MLPQSFIFIGRSGSGKGTQVELLRNYLNEKSGSGGPLSLVLSSGDKFREFIKGENHSSLLVKNLVNNGNLPPDFLAVWLWTSSFVQLVTGNEHLLIDGFPRRSLEARVLGTALNFYNLKSVFVVYLDVSEDEASGRLVKRGREDDRSPEAIKNRQQYFVDSVTEVLDYYREAAGYKFLDINGEGQIMDIHRNIVDALEKEWQK